MASGPLSNVRILDLTHVWAGPLATRILADLGAQVVKIEAPMGRGPRVYLGMPIAGFIGREPGTEPYNKNAAFVKLQRNKQSVAMDLKTDLGRHTFLELVKTSDVVIENFSARTMSELKLDYRYLKRANPNIIHIAMPGFGLSGPYCDRVAFGPTVEPMSGLTHVMGYSKREPMSTAMALPDPIAAVHAVCAVTTAIREREKTGKGLLVEMSLHESAVSSHGAWLIESQLGGKLNRLGNRHPRMAPHGVYQCSGDDQWVAITCRDNSDWRALCRCIGKPLNPDLSVDERLDQHDKIDQYIDNWSSQMDHESVVQVLQDNRVPAGHVRTTPDMTHDKHAQARGFFVPLENDTPIPGNPIKMRGISTDDWTPCPRFGNDNEKILKEWLGLTENEIKALYKEQVIFDTPPK